MRTKLGLNLWMIVPLMAALMVMVGGLDVHALEADPARYFVHVYQEEVAGREQLATGAGLLCTEDTAWATPAACEGDQSSALGCSAGAVTEWTSVQGQPVRYQDKRR